MRGCVRFLRIFLNIKLINRELKQQRFNNMKDSSGSYSNPTQIATKFNNFFANVGPMWVVV